MGYVYALNVDGRLRAVVSSPAAALRHAAVHLLGCGADVVGGEMTTLSETYDGAMGYLRPAHLLSLHQESARAAESASVVFHDTDALAGKDTGWLEYEIIDSLDPNYMLVRALWELSSGGDVEAIEERLVRDTARAVSRALERHPDAAQAVDAFRHMQGVFGYRTGDRRNLIPGHPEVAEFYRQASGALGIEARTSNDVPEATEGGNAEFLEALPARALERFRELSPFHAPLPGRAPSP